ncbi:hypothetical protein B0H14DRAFT_3453618 [Mycena olivaceomarginata]|nr:hypothetical protein B0H14DRAFT_3453618 [Mycena olivaceomarginata]
MANRMTTRSSSLTRTPSPIGSESSDFYYDDPVFNSTFTSPPRAANEHNTYDSDASEAISTDTHNATLTPQPTHAMSTASIVEITMDERPATPIPDAAPAKCGKAGKKKQRQEESRARRRQPLPCGRRSARNRHVLGPHNHPRPRHKRHLLLLLVLAPKSPSKRIRTSPEGSTAPAAHQATSVTDSPFLTPHRDRGYRQPPDDPTRSPQPPRPQVLHPAPLPTMPPKLSQLARPPPPLSLQSRRRPPPLRQSPLPSPPAAAVPAPTAAAPVTPRRRHRAEAAPMGPVWLTADQNPPRGSYTPTPPGGFPEVVYSSALLTQGMPPGLMQLYHDVPDPKFFVVPSATTSTWTRRAFHLGTPPTSENGPSSVLWMVAGLPPHLAQAVLDQPALSSRPITLFTIPFHMPVIGFIGTFGGFTLPNSQGGADAVRDLLQMAIQANGDINEFVRTHRDALGPQVSADQAWHIFSNSIAVEGMELLMSHLPFHQSPDRPSAPSPRLPGWLGPTPDTITALAEASRQAAAKAQELIQGNTAPGPSGSAHRAGGFRWPWQRQHQ